MGISRYKNLKIIDDGVLETSEFPSREDLDKVKTLSIRLTGEDRLDTIAAKYLGDDSYWWIIALMNDLTWSFDFVPGKIIKVPIAVQDVLDLM